MFCEWFRSVSALSFSFNTVYSALAALVACATRVVSGQDDAAVGLCITALSDLQ